MEIPLAAGCAGEGAREGEVPASETTYRSSDCGTRVPLWAWKAVSLISDGDVVLGFPEAVFGQV